LLLFIFDFLKIRFVDIVDILLVASLIFILYRLLKGTIAANIFFGLLSIYFIWILVKALNMNLLSAILGQFLGVGVLLILIVFQQEVRKFLLLIGQRNFFMQLISIRTLQPWKWKFTSNTVSLNYNEIIRSCSHLSKNLTGAIIVLTKSTELRGFASTGVLLDAELSSKILESIFHKNSPLHDGAIIIVKNRIRAASCILPVSENNKLQDNLGLRHRAGLGITEVSDAIAIIVSEENGSISFAEHGQIQYNISLKVLRDLLDENFINY